MLPHGLVIIAAGFAVTPGEACKNSQKPLTTLRHAARIGFSSGALLEFLGTNKIMSTEKRGLFVTGDGKNLVFTFTLVTSLFLLWGICNGMIDAMDKHFQMELNLSKSQSAWVQFAHYLGYFLMAMPAGWLAIRLGYKGGIIAGLLMVAAGGFWFIPATRISALAHLDPPVVAQATAFIAFLTGVCVIAAGLTFLETIANPYTTVLGPQRYAATRINLAQSMNGVGWVFGPILASIFFYGKNAAGKSTGSETLYIPYVVIAGVVVVLSAVFYFAYIPDIRAEDDYHLDDASPNVTRTIWSHPHFVLAVAAQFFYVAAQAGIFSFFINYMTLEVPAIPQSLNSSMTKAADRSPGFIKGWLSGWFETRTVLGSEDVKDFASLAGKLKHKSDPVSSYLSGKLSDETARALADYDDSSPAKLRSLEAAVLQDLNDLTKKEPLYDPKEPARFSGVRLSEPSREFIRKQEELEKNKGTLQGDDLNRFNRMLLQDAYPKKMPFTDGILCISDSFAASLQSLGFVCFVIGRFTGTGFIKRFSAHKVLALYGVLNVLVCLLIFCKLGWLSMACVFLSFFFMSIMFPTIFALGIFGLGARAKKASSYIVMAIMGGAILPKLMGYVADQYDMSRSFIVPMACFGFVALYGFLWPKLAGAKSMQGASASKGH
jgi:fucose permease